jgi:Flp pilus assembly pilin Flp
VEQEDKYYDEANQIKSFCFEEKGGLVEYVLIITLITLASITAMTNVRTKIIADITSMVTNL